MVYPLGPFSSPGLAPTPGLSQQASKHTFFPRSLVLSAYTLSERSGRPRSVLPWLNIGLKGVKWTSLDPVRMGYASEASLPVIVWVGVVPGSLSAEDGVEIATHGKSILFAHGIDDVHVEIRQSEVIRSAGPKMYKPARTYNATALCLEPFSTAIGLPICAEATPSIEGTGGFFISDPLNPGKIYLVTARHVVFHPDKEFNELYKHHSSS
ncbi:hypothetical protein FRB95_012982 [Tulasnella sp. JGI-2019a]|nr:hypothetical protein FRB95_012982 [Tulasnella sp. JGI-2019a]